MLKILSMHRMQSMDLPELDHWLQEDEVPPFKFLKSFLDAQYDPAVALHSSGSTGNPKPLTWTHGLLAAADAFRLIPSLGGPQCIGSHWEAQRVFTLFPWFHGCGLIFYLPMAIYNGFTPVLPCSQRDNKPGTLKAAIEHGGVTAAFLAPSTLIEIAKDVPSFSLLERLEHITYTGGILPLDVGETLSRRTRLMGCWGSTEAGLLPTEVPEAEDWPCYKFSPFLGSYFRHFKDDLYEHVIVRTHLLQGFQGVFFTFPGAHEYSMRDLYRKHPTKDNLWLPNGRVDDVITFSDARKLNPLLIEAEIQAHPSIDVAMICGQGRAQPALLLQPRTHQSTDPVGVDFIENIWPFIQDVNRHSPLTGQLTKSLTLLTDPEKPVAKAAGKDTILRKRTIDSYGVEIDQLYQAASFSSLADPLPSEIACSAPNGTHDAPAQKISTINQDSMQAERAADLPPEHLLEQPNGSDMVHGGDVEFGLQATESHRDSSTLNFISRTTTHSSQDCLCTAQSRHMSIASRLSYDDDLWRLVFAVSQ